MAKVKQRATYSLSHIVILSALRRYAQEYQDLCKEYRAFDPKAYKPDLDAQASYHLRFKFSLEESAIVVVLLSANSIEALANLYLSLKTDTEQFRLLERAPIVDKWVRIPTLFEPRYKLSKSLKLYKDLVELVKTRNALTHHKPHIVINRTLIHKGKLFNLSGDRGRFISHCASLPSRLVKHLAKYDKTSKCKKFLMLSTIPPF